MHEAEIVETETGLQPAGEGWWILNLADLGWFTVPGGGTWSSFEPPGQRSAKLGIGVHVLPPGETPGFYHLESEQEGFLVLAGHCLAIVEGQERRMAPWDYLHCPPGTAHITIGAGDEPCAILMVGTRSPDETTHYPADPVAAPARRGRCDADRRRARGLRRATADHAGAVAVAAGRRAARCALSARIAAATTATASAP